MLHPLSDQISFPWSRKKNHRTSSLSYRHIQWIFTDPERSAWPLKAFLLLSVANNKTSSNVNHNTFIRRRTSLQGARCTTKASWDKYSTRSHTSIRDYFGVVGVMCSELGSADKYSTASVNHGAELSWHYCSQPEARSTAPPWRLNRLLKWSFMPRRAAPVVHTLLWLLIFSFRLLSIPIISPLIVSGSYSFNNILWQSQSVICSLPDVIDKMHILVHKYVNNMFFCLFLQESAINQRKSVQNSCPCTVH